MDANEILAQEYNNLWNEKLIHKQGIRKFHNYLTYISAIGSLALAFHGLNMQDVIASLGNSVKAQAFTENAHNIINLFFVSFTPVLLLTVTFPLNDLYHIYAIGNHIGNIEKKFNMLQNKDLLIWEHEVCPKIYGGKPDDYGNKMSNIISLGDLLILVPVLILIGAISTIYATIFIYKKAGLTYSILYLDLVIYMFGTIVALALRLNKYTSPTGKMSQIIKNVNAAFDPRRNNTLFFS